MSDGNPHTTHTDTHAPLPAHADDPPHPSRAHAPAPAPPPPPRTPTSPTTDTPPTEAEEAPADPPSTPTTPASWPRPLPPHPQPDRRAPPAPMMPITGRPQLGTALLRTTHTAELLAVREPMRHPRRADHPPVHAHDATTVLASARADRARRSRIARSCSATC